jgi:hypothetical protein
MATNYSVSGGASQRHHAVPLTAIQHRDDDEDVSMDGKHKRGKTRGRGVGAGHVGNATIGQ